MEKMIGTPKPFKLEPNLSNIDTESAYYDFFDRIRQAVKKKCEDENFINQQIQVLESVNVVNATAVITIWEMAGKSHREPFKLTNINGKFCQETKVVFIDGDYAGEVVYTRHISDRAYQFDLDANLQMMQLQDRAQLIALLRQMHLRAQKHLRHGKFIVVTRDFGSKR